MQQFAQLVNQLANNSKTNEKLEALVQYFNTAPMPDRVWTIALFTGRRPRRFANSTQLFTWLTEITQLPAWLLEECYHTVGDFAETAALLLGQNKQDRTTAPTESLSHLIDQFIRLQSKPDDDKKQFVMQAWQQMDYDTCFVFNKLITGGFRIGVSQKLMVNALSLATGLAPSTVAHRISGQWNAQTTSFTQLMEEPATQADPSKPYPFFLAHPLQDEVENLGDIEEWQAEWKWDGIRGQLIVRNQELFIWSRGEELLTERFPELHELLKSVPSGTCIDGELIALQPVKNTDQGMPAPAPFNLLQTRITRKQITKKQLQQAPVGFIAYDLLEWNHEDIRQLPLYKRRQGLEKLVRQVQHPLLLLSPIVVAHQWNILKEMRQSSREWLAEGLMLKHKQSPYLVGRKTGEWWKWKIEPLTIDAVMIYAQKGHGRRSNLYTDYTFAVRDGEKLVPFTKAYSGLTDKEFTEVDAFVKKNALEKFGPVRTVKPELVFEIAFEGIQASNRHKSGVALRFPRMARWRKDKKPEDINTLDDLKQLLRLYGNSG
ncbi:MAG TPA: ATP-dependent DNA ligase [Phnomibacter sp.]|nr:ATP-dependent DNA ligase [Phnomibacter sp.]